ncbi:MAG: hypothetical protein QXI60_11790 [Thermofilaceae archaeon]
MRRSALKIFVTAKSDVQTIPLLALGQLTDLMSGRERLTPTIRT